MTRESDDDDGHHRRHRHGDEASPCAHSALFKSLSSTLPGAGDGLFAAVDAPVGTQLHFTFSDKGRYRIRLPMPDGEDRAKEPWKLQHLDDTCLANKANESPEPTKHNANIIMTTSTASLQLTRDVVAGEEIFTHYGHLFERNQYTAAAAPAPAATFAQGVTDRINALLVVAIVFMLFRKGARRE